MRPDEFTCFPRFHQDEVESSLKRAGRYQRKLIREFRAYIEELGGEAWVVQGKGSFRIWGWKVESPSCHYGGLYVSQYTPIPDSTTHHFMSEVIVEEVILGER